MHCVDTRDNLRIASLIDMFQSISVATDPSEVVRLLRRHVRRTDEYATGVINVSTRGLEPGSYKITRRWLTDDFENDRTNPWRDWDSLPTHRGGFLGEVIRFNYPELIHHLDIRNDPILGNDIATFGSCMVIPTFLEGKVSHWSIFLHPLPEGFTVADLEQRILTTNLVGSAVRHLVVAKEVQVLNGALTQQFEQVARVQQSLLPDKIPQVPGLKIATSYLTSDQAGGDYYDFFRLPDDRWGFLIADVSGHGAGAATVMAMLHAILHSYDRLADGPASVLRYANARLVDAHMDGGFVTALFAVYDPRTRELRFSRAGHPEPLLKEGGTGAVRRLAGAAYLPLGIFDEYRVEETSLTLHPLDTVILYTDGITEAFNTAKEMFGIEGLDAAMTECSGEPDCAVDSIHTALYKHTNSRSRADDQTLVVLRVTEEQAA
jgi:sigma-B regulation protein RsbU (phosphoserine phosphatase)